MKKIKDCIKKLIAKIVKFIGRFDFGLYLYEQILNYSLNSVQTLNYKSIHLKFSVPTALNKYRVRTFATKEPETLEWIDSFERDSILWDIGANIGLYTCYAALARGSKVFAFEPSIFNLEFLARNIYHNNLFQKVTVVPLPLSDRLQFSSLKMTTTSWGGAMSTFSESYGHDGLELQKLFEYPTIGLSISDAITSLNIPKPDYIKIDVDGIEHLILKGGIQDLKAVRSILIEVNDEFHEQSSECERLLTESGFTLSQKRHADFFDDSQTAARHTYNQIWVRK
jgi:FkbM family methyltransferase